MEREKVDLLTKLVLCFGFSTVIGTIVVVAVWPQPPRPRYVFTGVLEHISYESTLGGRIVETRLHFGDKTIFEIDGYQIYALGKNYTITYEVYPISRLSGDKKKVLSVEMED